MRGGGVKVNLYFLQCKGNQIYVYTRAEIVKVDIIYLN